MRTVIVLYSYSLRNVVFPRPLLVLYLNLLTKKCISNLISSSQLREPELTDVYYCAMRPLKAYHCYAMRKGGFLRLIKGLAGGSPLRGCLRLLRGCLRLIALTVAAAQTLGVVCTVPAIDSSSAIDSSIHKYIYMQC
jgi:hypothetical protein